MECSTIQAVGLERHIVVPTRLSIGRLREGAVSVTGVVKAQGNDPATVQVADGCPVPASLSPSTKTNCVWEDRAEYSWAVIVQKRLSPDFRCPVPIIRWMCPHIHLPWCNWPAMASLLILLIKIICTARYIQDLSKIIPAGIVEKPRFPSHPFHRISLESHRIFNFSQRIFIRVISMLLNV